MNKVFFFFFISLLITSLVNAQNCSEYEKLFSKNQFKKIIKKANYQLKVDNNDMCALNFLLLSLHDSKKYDDLKSITSSVIQDELSGKIQFTPEVYATISVFFDIKKLFKFYSIIFL
jgi:hypothetical protein